MIRLPNQNRDEEKGPMFRWTLIVMLYLGSWFLDLMAWTINRATDVIVYFLGEPEG